MNQFSQSISIINHRIEFQTISYSYVLESKTDGEVYHKDRHEFCHDIFNKPSKGKLL